MRFQEIQLDASMLNPPEQWASLRMPTACEPGMVSVIVPTYNRAVFLPEAIDSVLAQTYRPIELLIVDDGSTDDSAELVRAKLSGIPDRPRFSAIFIRQPNRGASTARNQGLLHSCGEFIQYLDSDDVLVRHKLERHVAAMADDSLDIVWSRWRVMPSEEVQDNLRQLNDSKEPTADFHSTDELLPWEPWPTFYRRRFVASHSLWNEHVSRWDDWEYALRLMAANPALARSEDILCIQREHNQGRRYDFDFNPEGVERGLIACREAERGYRRNQSRLRCHKQLLADRYWEVGLEALHRGKKSQTTEAFRGSANFGARLLFRMKSRILWLLEFLFGNSNLKQCIWPMKRL